MRWIPAQGRDDTKWKHFSIKTSGSNQNKYRGRGNHRTTHLQGRERIFLRIVLAAGVRRESRQDTVCTGQREHVELWRDARPALPATAVHAEQAGAVCEGCGTGRGGGYPQG